MRGERGDYLSYLLRVWRSGGGKTVWRASLERPKTGQLHSFASLESLLAFLKAETGNLDAREPKEE